MANRAHDDLFIAITGLCTATGVVSRGHTAIYATGFELRGATCYDVAITDSLDLAGASGSGIRSTSSNRNALFHPTEVFDVSTASA